MVFHWLRDLNDGLVRGSRRRRLSQPRPRASHAVSAAAMVQQLEPRVLLSVVPAGPEFRVNTFTTGIQSTGSESRSVAVDADGDYVVTWWSNGQDGSGYGVYAQRYNAAGLAQGSEFRVNTFTTSTQGRPPNLAHHRG